MSHPESSDDGSPSPPLRRQRHQFFYDYIRERDAVVIERVPSSEVGFLVGTSKDEARPPRASTLLETKCPHRNVISDRLPSSSLRT